MTTGKQLSKPWPWRQSDPIEGYLDTFLVLDVNMYYFAHR
jgi:hypothetical protein